MSDMIADAPVADSAPSSAPAPEATTEAPQPVRNDPIPAEPKEEPKDEKVEEPKKPVSTREALQKAQEKLDRREKDAETREKVKEAKPVEAKEPQPEAKKPAAELAKAEEPKTAPNPAPKPSEPASDAPARFSADAKVAWATAPEPVKAEVTRAFKELESGLEKYRADATEFESVRQFHEMAKANGSNLKAVLSKVEQFEDAFMQGPLQGLQHIANHFGFSLRDAASAILGQSPDQQASAQDATILELRQELAGLKKQLGGVTQTFETQQREGVVKSVADFAAQNPRFDELSEPIVKLLETGMAKDLSEAYSMADRLNPAPSKTTEPAPAPAPAPAPSVQPDKGAKSISGAPTPGSNPAQRQPSSSIRDAIKRAAAAAG